jgi:phage gp36-like protein
VSQYAQPADLATYGINPIALQHVDLTAQNNALVAASERMDSYFNGRYALPLLPPFDISIVMNCSYIAAYILMSVRGFRPEQGADDLLRMNFQDAIKWCEGVQRQAIHPNVMQSTSPLPNTFVLPQVQSAVPRGWNGCRGFGPGNPEGVG